jgi:hypothetical protein
VTVKLGRGTTLGALTRFGSEKSPSTKISSSWTRHSLFQKGSSNSAWDRSKRQSNSRSASKDPSLAWVRSSQKTTRKRAMMFPLCRSRLSICSSKSGCRPTTKQREPSRLKSAPVIMKRLANILGLMSDKPHPGLKDLARVSLLHLVLILERQEFRMKPRWK